MNIEPYPGDVPLAGDDAVTATHIDDLLKLLATVSKRFGNTIVRYTINWGASGLRVQDEQSQEIARLRAWVNDLHSGMYLNCVFCGHRYGPVEDDATYDGLKQHITQCPEHPMSHLRDAIQEIIDTNDCSCSPTCTGLYPFCVVREAMKKAIEASTKP